MKVAITYKIMEQDDDGFRTIVGPHTVVQEHPTEEAAKEACFAMCRTMFPDTAHKTREYYVGTKIVDCPKQHCPLSPEQIAEAHRDEPVQHHEHY